MQFSLHRNLLELPLHADVLPKLLLPLIEFTAESAPDELPLFLPFVEPLFNGCIRASAVHCLAVILLHPACVSHALQPRLGLVSRLRQWIMTAPLKCIPNLFVILNAVLAAHTESASAFADEVFVRHTAILLDSIHPALSGPLFLFVDFLIDDHLPILCVSGVLVKVLAIADDGAFEQRKRVAFIIAHLLHVGADLAEYPPWLPRSLSLLLRTIDSLSPRKCLASLRVLLDLVHQNPAYFIARIRSNEFEYVLQDLMETGTPDLAESSRQLYAACFEIETA